MIPKTVTFRPRAGNPTPRTVETASGLLNAIGLDNDGIDHFRTHHLPYLRTVGTAVIANIAGEDEDQFVAMAEMLADEPGLAAVELNVSCPNVSHGLDLGIDPPRSSASGAALPAGLPAAGHRQADAEHHRHRGDRPRGGRRRGRRGEPGQHVSRHGGRLADAAADPGLRRRRPGWPGDQADRPAHGLGRRPRLPDLPIIGIGGIASADDALEFLVAGASAVQVGTATFYDPTVSGRILTELPEQLKAAGVSSVREMVGSLRSNRV